MPEEFNEWAQLSAEQSERGDKPHHIVPDVLFWGDLSHIIELPLNNTALMNVLRTTTV